MSIDWSQWGGWIAAATFLCAWFWRHTSAVRRMALFEGRTLSGIEQVSSQLNEIEREMRKGFKTVHKRIDDHLEASIARKDE